MPATSPSPLRLLLIESSAEQCSIISRLISDSNELTGSLTLKAASRVSTGCHWLATDSFDLILLDLSSPLENGTEIYLRVRGRSAGLPIVVLTSPQDEGTGRQALELGAADHLIHGLFDGRQLMTVLRHAVEHERLVLQWERLLGEDPLARLALDDAGVVRFANIAAEALLNRKRSELEGKPFGYRSGETRSDIEIYKKGRRLVEFSWMPILWRGVTSQLVTLHDVSDANEIVGLRQELAANLAAVQIKDQLINGVSHEMRNPLTIIKTALYALKSRMAGPVTPQQDKFIDMAARNVERQIRMVENVLDLGRLRSGQCILSPQSFDLLPLFDQLSEEFQMANPSARLEVELPKSLPMIRADADLISQVLRNLLDNAFRFTKEKVVLKASSSEHELIVSVIDDGTGIPKEHLGELFHQYVQVHRPSGRGYKGTGLGLAICREIVERHGGRIWVDSVFGKGSRFHFALPFGGPTDVMTSTKTIYQDAMVGS